MNTTVTAVAVWDRLATASLSALAHAWYRSDALLEEMRGMPPETRTDAERDVCNAAFEARRHLHEALDAMFPGLLQWWAETDSSADEFELAHRAAASPELARQMACQHQELTAALRVSYAQVGLDWDVVEQNERDLCDRGPLTAAALAYLLA